MKKIILLTFLLLASICLGQLAKENDPILNPGMVNKKKVDKINNKDISFYLNHKSIDANAKLFYQGKFALSDDDKTFAICDSLTTKNPETRPFYFYVFCRFLELSDGALSEVLGSHCMEFINNYPCEFVRNLDTKEYQTDVKEWAAFIAFELGIMDEAKKFENKIDKKIKNCISSSPAWINLKKEIRAQMPE